MFVRIVLNQNLTFYIDIAIFSIDLDNRKVAKYTPQSRITVYIINPVQMISTRQV